MTNDIPCCQADVLRRIQMVDVNGIPTGINMVDEIIRDVKTMDLSFDQEVQKMRISGQFFPDISISDRFDIERNHGL